MRCHLVLTLCQMAGATVNHAVADVPENWPIQRHPRRVDPSLPPEYAIPRRQTSGPSRQDPIPEDLWEDTAVEYTYQGLQSLCKGGISHYNTPDSEEPFLRAARDLTETFRLEFADCVEDTFKEAGASSFPERAVQMMKVGEASDAMCQCVLA